MSTPNKPAARSLTRKKTYFGLTGLITGVISGLFLLANYNVANMKISPHTFDQLNNLTALFYCILTPLTFILGVIGHTRKNDSIILSRIAIALVVIPFIFIFARVVDSFIR
jgi:hypothetical protein